MEKYLWEFPRTEDKKIFYLRGLSLASARYLDPPLNSQFKILLDHQATVNLSCKSSRKDCVYNFLGMSIFSSSRQTFLKPPVSKSMRRVFILVQPDSSTIARLESSFVGKEFPIKILSLGLCGLEYSVSYKALKTKVKAPSRVGNILRGKGVLIFYLHL